MNQLKALQAEFQSYLLAAEPGNAFQNAIVDDAKVGAARRLAIYYHAYRFRLMEVLFTAYPKLHELVGDELFETIQRSYIAAHPSPYRNVRWYGEAMRTHVANTLPQYVILSEMADFEWTMALAFDAADSPVLELQQLAAIAPEDWAELRFTFQPSLHFLQLRCNTVAVWKALDAEQAPPAFEQYESPETWLIWRRDLNPHFRSIDAMQESALSLAVGGASFGDICESLQSQLDEEEASIKAAQYLAGWLKEGLIANFRTDSKP